MMKYMDAACCNIALVDRKTLKLEDSWVWNTYGCVLRGRIEFERRHITHGEVQPPFGLTPRFRRSHRGSDDCIGDVPEPDP
jgi:hypothetical protein